MDECDTSQFSESELRSAIIELLTELSSEFRSARRPDVAAGLDLVRERLGENRADEAIAMWSLVAPKLPSATSRSRILPISRLAVTVARALSELTGFPVPEPDFDAPPPPSSVGTAVKRCILFLFGAGSLALGIVVIRMQPLAGAEEIARIACALLFVIAGPVFLVRAFRGDRRQVDEDFWKLLDGL